MDQAADNVRLISTVELYERRILRRETGKETNRNTTTLVPITDDRERLSNATREEGNIPSSTSNKDEWLISIVMDGGGEHQCQKPRIQLVPDMLRDVYSKETCFDPMVVSIGPYHHGKPELQLVEKLKITTARQFVSGSEKPIETFYNKVVEVSSKARECYIEGSTVRFSDEEFSHMLFLDGCFVLHLIECMVKRKRGSIKMKCHQIAFVLRDLFLLENQLPFLVLQELMSLKFPVGEGKEIFKNFIKQQIRDPRSLFLQEKKADAGEDQPLHLLELMRTELLGKSTASSGSTEHSNGHSIRSVKELKTAGIDFKKSGTSCFNDIYFEPGIIQGVLSLPPIAIDDSGKAKLLNLIAYETCPGTPDDNGITSYICFMDKLIDHADDVKELRSEGIGLNFLGNDEEVASLFNQIAIGLVPNPNAFAGVRREIEKIYKNKCKTWMTEMLHKHFSTPWATVAFLAALYLLALGTVQTYFTIFPL